MTMTTAPFSQTPALSGPIPSRGWSAGPGTARKRGSGGLVGRDASRSGAPAADLAPSVNGQTWPNNQEV